ncbi:SLC13 family permease [Endozoicomonas arenosclerae]|uniref:SLC13 family permease n=1 Tax=Endozoicomonas arenosclerae TaxID=1633495 RepID=UPI000782623C|nr:SLC13 family permease [Endozoicomonas arenosclerae]
MSRYNKLAIIASIYIILLVLPVSAIPIEGITVAGQRVLALFILATLLWVTELVPAFSTSLMILGLLAVTVSDSTPFILRDSLPPETLLSYKEIMASLAAPVIVLFMGGFFIAIAATKYKLDINMARVLLKPIGSNYANVMLGLMAITATFSMFMSNTATTAMMLALLAPLLQNVNKQDPGIKAMVMAIPIAANLGGIGTPIGTPPNAIAFRYLTGEYSMSFGDWMMFAVPVACVLILISWYLLRKIYPTSIEAINLEIHSAFEQSAKAKVVYITTALTILLWITSSLHGINSYTVALLPVIVFSLTGIIDTKDIKQINWDVLWLIAGGIALGYALEQSGPARAIVNMIPFDTLVCLTCL